MTTLAIRHTFLCWYVLYTKLLRHRVIFRRVQHLPNHQIYEGPSAAWDTMPHPPTAITIGHKYGDIEVQLQICLSKMQISHYQDRQKSINFIQAFWESNHPFAHYDERFCLTELEKYSLQYSFVWNTHRPCVCKAHFKDPQGNDTLGTWFFCTPIAQNARCTERKPVLLGRAQKRPPATTKCARWGGNQGFHSNRLLALNCWLYTSF